VSTTNKNIAMVSCRLGGIDGENGLTMHRTQTVPVDAFVFDDANFPKKHDVSSRLQAKIPKMLGWKLRPGYKYYIWLDSTIIFKDENTVNWLVESLGDNDIGLFQHKTFFKSNVQEEVDYCIRQIAKGNEYLSSRYNINELKEQCLDYLSDDSFKDGILYCGGIFIYRNTEKVRGALTEWFLHNVVYTVQDQVSLPYIVHRRGLSVSLLNGTLESNPYIDHVFTH